MDDYSAFVAAFYMEKSGFDKLGVVVLFFWLVGGENSYCFQAPTWFCPCCPQFGFSGGRTKKSGVTPRKVSVSRNLLYHMGGGDGKSDVAPGKVSVSRNLLWRTGGRARKSGVLPIKVLVACNLLWRMGGRVRKFAMAPKIVSCIKHGSWHMGATA